MSSIQGTVQHIIYRNPENGYTVLTLSAKQGETTLVGSFGTVEEGDFLTAEGEMVRHSSYGEQFRADSAEVREPDSRDSMLLYLSSGAVKGMGAALAERVVNRFGDDTFRIFSEEPERLAEIRGISLRKAGELAASFAEKAGMRRAVMFLQKYGIGNILSVRIYERYRENLYSVIEENPYRMTEEVEGIGFKTADAIASRSGVERHSGYRIRSGILYALSLSTGEGNVYMPEEMLLKKAAALLEVEPGFVEEQLESLAVDRKIVRKRADEGIRIYLTSFYRMEKECALLLRDLDLREDISDEEVLSGIGDLEQESGLVLAEDQRRAVMEAVENGIFIMTGGPGTGKTTTIRILLRLFLSRGMHVLLAAPTGRAARRMSQAAGMEAVTIHRLLEVSAVPDSENGGRELNRFARNAGNPLETDVVVVDEMSMMDLPLFYALLSAMEAGMKLIMVGDEHQLPSVGPGSVLRDLISSGRFHTVTLKKIFRQAELSDIVMNAHAVLTGKAMKLDNQSRDFFFLQRLSPEEIIEGVIYLVGKKLPPYVGAAPEEIQVLSPMRKGILGVESLNIRLQAALNPPDPRREEIVFGSMTLREGDKVMQVKNDYQKEWERLDQRGILKEAGTGIFNGDIGIVSRIDRGEEKIRVRFDDGRECVFLRAELSDLELAYAVTIHKSQGSEYPAVVLPLLKGPELLMNRSLLYTAITRAKKCVMIIGSRETVSRMAENTAEAARYTSLTERIRES